MKLSTVEMYVPSQFRNSEEWDLQADIWLLPHQFEYQFELETRVLRFGFKKATLTISSDPPVKLRQHFEEELEPVEIIKASADQKTNEKEFEAGLFLKLFPFLKSGTRLKSDTRKTKDDTRTEKTLAKRFRVQSLDANVWEITGHDHEFGILEGKVLSAEPLCLVRATPKEVTFEASISVSTHNLWVGVFSATDEIRTTPDQFNRDAVLKALLARYLKAPQDGDYDSEHQLSICSQSYTVSKEDLSDG